LPKIAVIHKIRKILHGEGDIFLKLLKLDSKNTELVLVSSPSTNGLNKVKKIPYAAPGMHRRRLKFEERGTFFDDIDMPIRPFENT